MKGFRSASTGYPGRSGLADAIRYSLSRWPALCHFLDDGRIELDNNSVERAIRPVALGRKNHLFAGSDGGAERWGSLIASAKLNDVEPFGYLKDILQRAAGFAGHSVAATLKLFQECGETFRDRLVGDIVLRSEPSPDCPQPWPSGQNVTRFGLARLTLPGLAPTD